MPWIISTSRLGLRAGWGGLQSCAAMRKPSGVRTSNCRNLSCCPSICVSTMSSLMGSSDPGGAAACARQSGTDLFAGKLDECGHCERDLTATDVDRVQIRSRAAICGEYADE